MRGLVLVCLAACVVGDPEPLPAPQPTPTRQLDLRMVKAGEIEGYLGRPVIDESVPAELLLVDALDELAREQVRSRAEAGTGAFAVSVDVDSTAAEAYLDGMPWTETVSRVCLRSGGQCPSEEVGAP